MLFVSFFWDISRAFQAFQFLGIFRGGHCDFEFGVPEYPI